jgi:hypothetical protein
MDKRIGQAAALLGLLALLGGCRSAPLSSAQPSVSGTTEPGHHPPMSDPLADAGTVQPQFFGIRGTITLIRLPPPNTATHSVGSVLIEGVVEADTVYDRASVAVTHQTQIFDQTTVERRAVTFDALQHGQRVQVLFSGPVAESYPVQATAAEIIILRP